MDMIQIVFLYFIFWMILLFVGCKKMYNKFSTTEECESLSPLAWKISFANATSKRNCLSCLKPSAKAYISSYHKTFIWPKNLVTTTSTRWKARTWLYVTLGAGRILRSRCILVGHNALEVTCGHRWIIDDHTFTLTVNVITIYQSFVPLPTHLHRPLQLAQFWSTPPLWPWFPYRPLAVPLE